MIDDRFLPRVWTDKGYYYPIFSELGITYENKNLPFTKENIKDINWAFRWRFNHSNENVDMEYVNTIEQCTGLKDKNGQLIYEGDIVKLSSDREVVCPVVWDNEETGFCVKYKKELYRFNPYKKYHLIEVIGNIHENADLIKVGGK